MGRRPTLHEVASLAGASLASTSRALNGNGASPDMIEKVQAAAKRLGYCGAAMFMAPVGLANPGEPAAAYAEAIDVAGAHQSSYGREAAGVLAAAVAAAVAPGATLDSVLEAARRFAHDGTAAAISAVLDAVASVPPPVDDQAERELAHRVRAAVAPFDTVGKDYRSPAMDARRPSRTKSIEELPVALALLAAHRGDYRGAVLDAVNYGRDADSIASMAGALAAGLGGTAAVPTEWLDQIEQASRIDLRATGHLMAEVVADLVDADARHASERAARLAALSQRAGGEPR